jgi:hypothetical protein
MILAPGESNLKGWIAEAGMSGRMQSALIAALRGADSDDSPEVKRVVRWIRRQCLKEVNPTSHFMKDTDFIRIKALIQQDSWQWDRLKTHFYDHLKQALEVIAYYHPDEMTAARAMEAYTDLQEHESIIVESKSELIGRMKDSRPLAIGQLIVNDWVLNLPGHMQSTLECSLRGSDITADDEVRRVTRWLRWVVMKDVMPESHYMKDRDFMRIKLHFEEKPSSWGNLPIHFRHHTRESFEVIGYMHPDTSIRTWANIAYLDICDKSKGRPETRDALIARMQDKPGQIYEAVQQHTNLPVG